MATTQERLNDQVSGWLAALDAALKAQDFDAATELFQKDCYWRDLVSFTWNLKTVEPDFHS